MTMNLSDQLGMIEAENKRLKDQVETQKTRLAQQKALIDENRAERGRLMKRIEQQAELIGTYKNHFRSFHGSADSIQTQERTLEAAATANEIVEAVKDVVQPLSLKDRLTRVMKGDATNGHANGATH